MKIRIDRNTLLSRLQIAQNVVSQRSTLPVLANYLLETQEDGKLWITSTDLEVGIRSAVSAEVLEAGSITLPARKLGEILHSFPGGDSTGDVNIELKENNRVQLLGSRSRFQLAGISKEDYPAIPPFKAENAIVMPGVVLSEMIRKTIFAASTDETRYVLNGALFMIQNGTATMVATDGRRLAAVKHPGVKTDRNISVTIPAKALHEIQRVIQHIGPETDGNVQMDISENQVGFRVGETTLFSRLIEGAFPNWEQVIPKKSDIRVRLAKDGFFGVTKRASLCVAERMGTCHYRFFKDRCEVTSRTLGHYEFEESEKVMQMEGAEGFEVAFQPYYVLDFLKILDTPDFEIQFTTSVNPALFKMSGQEDYFYVVMPARPQG